MWLKYCRYSVKHQKHSISTKKCFICRGHWLFRHIDSLYEDMLVTTIAIINSRYDLKKQDIFFQLNRIFVCLISHSFTVFNNMFSFLYTLKHLLEGCNHLYFSTKDVHPAMRSKEIALLPRSTLYNYWSNNSNPHQGHATWLFSKRYLDIIAIYQTSFVKCSVIHLVRGDFCLINKKHMKILTTQICIIIYLNRMSLNRLSPHWVSGPFFLVFFFLTRMDRT